MAARRGLFARYKGPEAPHLDLYLGMSLCTVQALDSLSMAEPCFEYAGRKFKPKGGNRAGGAN